MKALLYKEFKLAMHPICYVFICLFPLMILIPSYPLGIGFIYLMSCYPILFLGANKGQQSNDLLYSTLLPIRKRDIVKARIFTVSIMQFAYIALMCALLPLAFWIQGQISAEQIAQSKEITTTIPGIPLEGFGSVVAIGLIGFSIADLIFFPIYYKNGKSIVMSTLLTILGFVVYLGLFTVGLPYIPVIGEGFLNIFCNPSMLWAQFAFLGVALVIYVVLHLLVYKISSKRLEKVDF